MSGRDAPGNGSGRTTIKRIEPPAEKAARKAKGPRPPLAKKGRPKR